MHRDRETKLSTAGQSTEQSTGQSAEQEIILPSQERINLSPEAVGKAFQMSLQFAELNGRIIGIEQKWAGQVNTGYRTSTFGRNGTTGKKIS